jgi:hypothetical protein
MGVAGSTYEGAWVELYFCKIGHVYSSAFFFKKVGLITYGLAKT